MDGGGLGSGGFPVRPADWLLPWFYNDDDYDYDHDHDHHYDHDRDYDYDVDGAASRLAAPLISFS